MPIDKSRTKDDIVSSGGDAARRVVFVDAFTREPFYGNPCAVVPDAQGLNTIQMQAIAKETNAPETAFVLPSDKGDFRVSYFTPRHEVPFAGHPTIATAYLLACEGTIPLLGPLTTIRFEFNIGVLPVDIFASDDNTPQWVRMTQPAPEFGPRLPHRDVAIALGLAPDDLLTEQPVQVVSTGVPFLCVPARNFAVLERVAMDRPRLRELLQGVGVNAAYLFCMEALAPENHAHARFLDPDNAGEDPYTGSAAGCLAAYAFHYQLSVTPELRLEQGHLLGRPGEGTLEVLGTPDQIEGIRLSGTAVRTFEGHFLRIPNPGDD